MRDNRNTWKVSYPKGKSAESKYGRLVAERYGLDFVHKDGGKSYDFILRGKKDAKIECKLEDKARYNIFLETSYKGEASGLAVTGADFWFICLPHRNEILIFKPADAIAYCKLNQARLVSGGDYGAARGYTVNIKRLKNCRFVTVFSIPN